jgi:pyruvate dehydrogenase E2 component (dihydrolipoyllysine-residue acetyltransferase)
MSSNSNDSVTTKCAPWPQIDSAAFGPVETKPLTRIQTLTSSDGSQLGNDPACDSSRCGGYHGTRPNPRKLSSISGSKITPLTFMVKAAVSALQAFPTFNASLDETGRGLVRRAIYEFI